MEQHSDNLEGAFGQPDDPYAAQIIRFMTVQRDIEHQLGRLNLVNRAFIALPPGEQARMRGAVVRPVVYRREPYSFSNFREERAHLGDEEGIQFKVTRLEPAGDAARIARYVLRSPIVFSKDGQLTPYRSDRVEFSDTEARLIHKMTALLCAERQVRLPNLSRDCTTLEDDDFREIRP